MIVMIDNYDSFTYNLVQLLWGRGVEVEVLRNDAASVDEILALRPRGIILSPGPGRPERAGICVDLVRSRPRVPLLGVCLGHQVLGAAFGAEIGRAPRLMHGKTSFIRHLDRGVFKSLSNPFEATRYHSLEVRQESLPEELEPLAWSDEETLMGMRHRQLPYQGVQFHPESILTIEGPQLMDNFLAECEGETRDSPREG
ncbi:MAG: aminodeoxychorismate/anthranilate synthase component II [Acidobacteria bacterium]|nr:MAG: aminodeoxychorismate/anthranilate synthase component II [Acidobacteriota bacterium]